MVKEMSKIYLASPFFDAEELSLVEIAEGILRKQGHTVFSPRENQLEGVEFGSREWRTDVFRNDIKHIQWADVVLAILTDNYDDTGTAMEVGYAYGLGKPILVINPKKTTLNLMITDSLHAYFETWSDVLNYDFSTLPIKPYTKGVI
jgi:nucleoside 2-deoxyribosyltransferase